MKKQLTILAILISALITGNCFAQGVGINNPVPASSAMLDVTSTSKGMLIPRMTSAQRLAIVAPATGLLVYETTTNQFFYFDGTLWKPFSSNTTGWNVTGNTGTVTGTNFIGTTDAKDFVVKTNNIENMRILTNGNIGIGTTAPSAKLSVSRVGGIDDIITLADDSNSLVVGTDFDLPGFIRIRPTSGKGIAITNNGDAVGLFVKSDASANVGIGTSVPTEKLHVNGNMRMDGALMPANNAGLNGQILISKGAGVAPQWSAAPVYYFAPNLSSATVAATKIPMANSTITFTPNHTNVRVDFSASGPASIGNSLLKFFINVNGVDILTSATSSEDLVSPGGIEWQIHISCIVPVNIGVSNNVTIFWQGTSGTFSNLPNANVPAHKSFIVTDM